jgi:hypothetical protein
MKPNPPRLQAVLNQLAHLDPRIGVIILVALIFLIAGTASTNSTPPQTQSARHIPVLYPKNPEQVLTPSPAPIEITAELQLTPSPLPPELLENGNQTIGLSIAASVIVLIVIVGVFNAILRSSREGR